MNFLIIMQMQSEVLKLLKLFKKGCSESSIDLNVQISKGKVLIFKGKF